ncbi:MAG: hypothetical protein ACK2UH_04625 [Candidatus Promineifilaceae bacterium]
MNGHPLVAVEEDGYPSDEELVTGAIAGVGHARICITRYRMLPGLQAQTEIGGLFGGHNRAGRTIVQANRCTDAFQMLNGRSDYER